MSRIMPRMVVVAALAALAIPALGQDESGELPTLQEMKLPTAVELLDQIEPLDWIVLQEVGGKSRVIVAEGVPDRPNTLEVYKEEKRKKISIIVPEAGIAEFTLPLNQIDRIIYAEEQMLMLADKLLETARPDDIETAFELVSAVERKIEGWEKTTPRLQQLLLIDARAKKSRGEEELALALLEECEEVKSGFAGVSPMVGEILNNLVSAAVNDEDFRKAQHYLDRCGVTFPDHPMRRQWLERLAKMAQVHYDKAGALFGENKFAEAAAEAQEGNRILRASGANGSLFRRVLSRFQQINVGVMSLGQKFPVTTSVQVRRQQLQATSLFEPVSADSVVYYEAPMFEQWDPLDLGRRAVFKLRKQQSHYAALPDVTSPNIIDTLKARLDKTNPMYDERFASYIKEFLVRSPYEFEIRFSRIPLRVESLFAFPLTNAAGEVYTKRFQKISETAEKTVFRRAYSEPDGLSNAEYHVAEVVEHKFDKSFKAIQALRRGELQMVAHLQPWEIGAFERNKDFYRRKYDLPFVHVVQFNPRNEVLQNPQVRRSLTMSIDRERILKRTVLRDESMRHGRIVAAPWHSRSYANSSLVDLPAYDIQQLRTAAALRGTAEMVLKTDEEREAEAKAKKTDNTPSKSDKARTKALPTLRLVLEEDPAIKAAAPEILKFWTAAGYKIEIVEPTDDPDGWDLVYHKVRMVEPLVELWPFLTLEEKAKVDGLLVLPDWLKQKVVDLDFSSNFPTAQENLRLLHKHLSAQGFFIPLWEVDDYAVFGTNVSGFSNPPVTPYQRVNQWVVVPRP